MVVLIKCSLLLVKHTLRPRTVVRNDSEITDGLIVSKSLQKKSHKEESTFPIWYNKSYHFVNYFVQSSKLKFTQSDIQYCFKENLKRFSSNPI